MRGSKGKKQVEKRRGDRNTGSLGNFQRGEKARLGSGEALWHVTPKTFVTQLPRQVQIYEYSM